MANLIQKCFPDIPLDISSIDFELNGQNFTALNGGPMYMFNVAISIAVNCKTQEEINKFWEALSEGGELISCGWLKDKYGLTWQIMPENLDIMMRDPDVAKADRVSAAMLSMDKLNIRNSKKYTKANKNLTRQITKHLDRASGNSGALSRCLLILTPLLGYLHF